MPKLSVLLSALLLGWAAPLAAAEVTLEQLRRHAEASGSPLDRAVAERWGGRQGESIRLRDGALLAEQTLGEQVLDDGCNGATLRRATLRVSLPPQSAFGLDYRSVLQPLRVSLDTRARIEASGSAVQYFGVGNRDNCTRLGSDNFDFAVDGELDLRLELTLDPRAELVEASALRLAPQLDLGLALGQRRVAVDVDSSVLARLLESALRDAIDDALAPGALQLAEQRAEAALQRSAEEALGGSIVEVELPLVDAALVSELRRWLGDSSDFPLSRAYLDDNATAIVDAALRDDRDALGDLLGGLLACQLGAVYLDDLPRRPLYARDGERCAATDALSGPLAGPFYADAACAQAVDVREQGLADYCRVTTDPQRLGDGSGAPAQVETWQLAPGPRLAITLPSFDDDSQQPYQGSLEYRRLDGPRGSCSLEMRVYTPQPGATELRPVLALHGGSWALRGAGFVGMESLMAHFTSRDMVVFAPFYRLAGDRDGPEACRQFVAEDILADAEAALDWVREHGARYGARAGKVGVFGQSAGGFLATWLALERAEQVDAALLMYPPTDVGAFVDDLDSGVYDNPRGVGILERFLGSPRADWPAQQARLQRLSLAERVTAEQTIPPMRAIHGLADELVLPDQSERLCAALGAGEETTLASGRLRRRGCGEGGQLDLIEGAEHALEVCPVGGDCLAGDLLSAAAAQGALREGYDWLASFDGDTGPGGGDGGQGGGDGGGQGGGDDGAGADGGDGEPGTGGGSSGGGVLGPAVLLALWWRRGPSGPRRSRRVGRAVQAAMLATLY